jgi:hypothetical protein
LCNRADYHHLGMILGVVIISCIIGVARALEDQVLRIIRTPTSINCGAWENPRSATAPNFRSSYSLFSRDARVGYNCLWSGFRMVSRHEAARPGTHSFVPSSPSFHAPCLQEFPSLPHSILTEQMYRGRELPHPPKFRPARRHNHRRLERSWVAFRIRTGDRMM